MIRNGTCRSERLEVSDFWTNFGLKWKEKAEKNSEGTKIAFGTVFGDAFLATGSILVDFLGPAGSQK